MDVQVHCKVSICVVIFSVIFGMNTALASKHNELKMFPLFDSALSELLVRDIYIDNNKVAWVGTDSGVYRYSNYGLEYLDYSFNGSAKSVSAPITNIFELNARYLAINYFPSGLTFFDRKLDQFIKFPFKHKFNYLLNSQKLDDNIAIWRDKNKYFWYDIKDDSLTSIPFDSPIEQDENINFIILQHSKRVIAFSTKRLFELDLKDKIWRKKLEFSFTNNYWIEFAESNNGNLHLFAGDKHYLIQNDILTLVSKIESCTPQQLNRDVVKWKKSLYTQSRIIHKGKHTYIVSECGIYAYDLTSYHLKPIKISSPDLTSIWLKNIWSKDGYSMIDTLDGMYLVDDAGELIQLSQKSKASNGGSTISIAKMNDQQYLLANGEPGLQILTNRQHHFNALSQSDLERLTGDNAMRKVIKQDNKTIWLASQNNGLFKVVLVDQHWQVAQHYLAATHIRDLFIEQDKVWIASDGNGLFCIDLKNNKVTSLLDKLALNFIMKIKPLNENIMILGVNHGVVLIDRKTMNIVKHIKSLMTPDGLIMLSHTWAISNDSKGNIWLASHHSKWSLFKLSPEYKVLEAYQHDDLPVYASASDMVLDQKEQPIIATWGGGIFYRKDGETSFSQLTMQDGLPSNSILSIYSIANDYWVSTDKGLAKVSLCQSTGCDHKVEAFSKSDGLSTNLFDLNSAHLNKDGSLIYGGFYAVNWFNPLSDIVQNNIRPSAHYLIKVLIDGKNASSILQPTLSEIQLTLPYDTQTIRLGYTSDDHVLTGKKQYHYRINGNSWIKTEKPEINLPLLSYGSYQIEANSSNSAGLWSKHPLILDITILKPYWLSVWAITFYITIILCIIFTIYRWRANKLIRENIKLERGISQRTQALETKTKELKISIEQKEKMFQNTSHELRTPLQSIISNVRLLKKQQTSCEATKHLEVISEQSVYLNEIVDGVLTNAEVLISEQEINQLNLTTLFNRIVDWQQAKALEKNISIELINLCTEATHIKLTKNGENHIFINLITNAIKFSPINSVISITLRQEANKCLISITDQGPGFSNIDKILQRFGREHTSYTGNGLGLDIVNEVIKMNDGEINFENLTPTGCQVHIKLPSYFSSKQKATTALEPLQLEQFEHQLKNKFTHKKLILIVEDSPLLQTDYQNEFGELFVLAIKSDGQEALDYLLCEEIPYPDIIISDVMMPNMDGFLLCNHIKSNELLSDIPLVLLTAKSDSKSQLTGITAGADLYESKPIKDINRFIQQLINLLFTQESKLKKLKNFILSEPTTVVHREKLNFVERVKIELERNYSDPRYKINRLYQDLGLTESQFRTELAKYNFKGTKEFLDNYRLEKALVSIESSKASFVTIAKKCGFSSADYMSKKIRKKYGSSPRTIRNSKTDVSLELT